MIDLHQIATFSVAAIAVAVINLLCFRGAKMNNEERVIQCIVHVTGIPADEVLPGMTKTDLCLDSMDEAELILFLEDEFNIEIPDEVVSKFATVGGLVSYINLRVQP